MAAGHERLAYDHSVLMHARIIARAHSSRLTQIMTLLADQTHRFGLLTLRNGRAAPAMAEHGEIIDAIAEGDGTLAGERMSRHLRADCDIVLPLILPGGGVPGW